jgi:hypothetical protein
VFDNQVKNCTLYPVGVGEQKKSVEMLEYPRNGGHNHIRATTRNTIKNIYTVQIETIDSYNFQDVGFIKIDVEGYEKFVLEGAQQLIQTSRPTIQLEIVSNQCRKFGYLAEDMIEWIRSWGYTVVSKNRGNLYGTFTSERTQIFYDGVHYKREMDLWFQPTERARSTQLELLFDLA